METFFRKYQFSSMKKFTDLNKLVDTTAGHQVVELGKVDGFYSVDALWVDTIPDGWEIYEIWDVEGNGIHTFLGHTFKEDIQ